MKCSLINLVIILVFHKCCSSDNKHIINKRFLVFPPSSPTRHQLIWGIGIPVDYEYQSIVTGIVLKAQYFMATTVAQNYPNADVETFPGLFKRKKRDLDKNQTNLIERYEQEAILLEEKSDFDIVKEYERDEWDDNDEDEDKLVYPEEFKENHNIDFETSRWTAYKLLEKIAEIKGFQGRVCVLRSICEAAEAPFTHRSGLMGELLHIVLAPTTTNEKISEHSDNDYLIAERHGNTGAKCDEIYKKCDDSLLETFSGVTNPLDWIL